VLLALVGITTGTGLVTAGLAVAASGSQPGNLVLSPASGATTLQPIWSTTDGCPSGYQGSAEVAEFKPDGTFASRISTVVNSGLTKAFQGTLDSKMDALLRFTGVANGGSVEWAVGCYSLEGGTGSVQYVQSTMITLASDGGSYTTSSSSSSTSPTTTPTSTPTATPTSTPSGGPQTGAGGASLPGSGNAMLIALGAMLAAGSAAAMGLAIRRGRPLPGEDGPGSTKQDGS
jgi:hypothetical protein